MKKFFISVLAALMLASASALPQEITRQGNTFVKVTKNKGKDLVVTKYKYVPNSKKPSEQYTVYIDRNTGACYIKRTSKTTGNQYDQRIDEETSKAIAKEMGIAYTYKPRSKKQ